MNFTTIIPLERIPLAAENVARNRRFVRHRNEDNPTHQIRRYTPLDRTVLTVIVPTIGNPRKGYLSSLLQQINRQTFKPYELIIVENDSYQGRAINAGVSIAKGKYILILDDDTSLPDPDTFRKLVSVMDNHQDIGIAGGNNIIPSDAPYFIRRVMQEIPRRSWKPVRKITDSDLAEHPCMIMRMDEFKAVGGENELIPRGLDPYLREQFRKFGKRVVVVPDVIYHHLPPSTPPKLLKQFFRNGRQAAFTNRHYPQWVIETPAQHGDFKRHISMPVRLLRYPFRLVEAMVSGKTIFFLSELAYAAGFVHEFSVGKKRATVGPEKTGRRSVTRVEPYDKKG